MSTKTISCAEAYGLDPSKYKVTRFFTHLTIERLEDGEENSLAYPYAPPDCERWKLAIRQAVADIGKPKAKRLSPLGIYPSDT